MKTLFKLFAVLIFLFVVALIGLNFLVKSYLKEDRIKSLVIPRVEEALGRKVEIGRVRVSIFKGVVLENFVIKESDGRTDFLRVGEFVLKYKLLPLLKKQIVISEVKVISPYIRIYRDSSGRFNYESLRVLKSKGSGKKAVKKGAKKGLPFALTVEKVNVADALVVVRDALKEIPDTDAKANAYVTLSMGRGGGLIFKGRSDFSAQLLYGVKVLLKGKASFTNTTVNYLVNADVDGEKLTFSGDVSDYMKHPSVLLNVSSSFIDLAKLKEVSEKLPKKEGRRPQASQGKKEAPSEIPVTLRGTVKVDKLVYDKIVAENFKADYSFKKNVFSLKELVLTLFGGSIGGSSVFDMHSRAYSGKLNVKGLDLGKLLPALLVSKSYVTGTSDASVSWRGRGLSWDVIKRTITADGVFAVRDGRFVNVEMVDAVLSLLGLDELKNLSFKELKGNFKVAAGKVLLKSVLNNPLLKMKANGYIGLDGSLFLPLVLKLSPELSARVVKKVSYAKYFPREDGWMVVPIKLKGTVTKPVPVPDINVKEQLKKEGVKLLEKAIKGKGGDKKAGGVLQKLFGR